MIRGWFMNGQSPFQKLSGSLDAWKKKSSGIWGIWMEDLNTGEKWIWNEKQPFVAASMIKVPVMVAVYRAHALGKLCLSDRIELRREDRVGGSGFCSIFHMERNLPFKTWSP